MHSRKVFGKAEILTGHDSLFQPTPPQRAYRNLHILLMMFKKLFTHNDKKSTVDYEN